MTPDSESSSSSFLIRVCFSSSQLSSEPRDVLKSRLSSALFGSSQIKVCVLGSGSSFLDNAVRMRLNLL